MAVLSESPPASVSGAWQQLAGPDLLRRSASKMWSSVGNLSHNIQQRNTYLEGVTNASPLHQVQAELRPFFLSLPLFSLTLDFFL